MKLIKKLPEFMILIKKLPELDEDVNYTNLKNFQYAIQEYMLPKVLSKEKHKEIYDGIDKGELDLETQKYIVEELWPVIDKMFATLISETDKLRCGKLSL